MNKTEIGQKLLHICENLPINTTGKPVSPIDSARNLGVIFDKNVTIFPLFLNHAIIIFVTLGGFVIPLIILLLVLLLPLSFILNLITAILFY